jgi:histidinol-phosphate/aromatic aminotransferase/cobyric acid decarboxylase-like protein
MKRNIHRVLEERKRVMRTMDKLGVRVFPSSTNFFLVKTIVPDVVRKLRDIGILISDLSNQLPSGFIRVSTGNREENDTFLAGFKKIRKAYD